MRSFDFKHLSLALFAELPWGSFIFICLQHSVNFLYHSTICYEILGFVTYTNRMKTEMVGVSEFILDTHGAVSRETAEAMAIGARKRSGASFALSVTGVAGPGGGTEKAPVGTVYVGVSDTLGCRVIHRQFLGDRTRIRQFSTQMALDALRRQMTGKLA